MKAKKLVSVRRQNEILENKINYWFSLYTQFMGQRPSEETLSYIYSGEMDIDLAIGRLECELAILRDERNSPC